MSFDQLENLDDNHTSTADVSIVEVTKQDSRVPNPTLDTITMVEEEISKMSECSSKNKLWRALPRQVQYPTFRKVLDYLADSNKIMFDKTGKIYWIFTDNPKLEKLHEESTKLR